MKKILCCFAVVLLMVGVVGCACNDVTANPSPTAAASPSPSPAMSSSPALSESPDAALSPDAGASTSPDAGASPDAGTSPDAGAGTSIPGFREGTEVKPEDVPEIKTALTQKYPEAKIKTVKHALKDGKQVYEVQLDNNGKTETVYVLPDGKLLDAASTAKPE